MRDQLEQLSDFGLEGHGLFGGGGSGCHGVRAIGKLSICLCKAALPVFKSYVLALWEEAEVKDLRFYADSHFKTCAVTSGRLSKSMFFVP